MSDYPIEVLSKDRDMILKALRETRAWINYPEQYRRQKNKVNALNKAIDKIRNLS